MNAALTTNDDRHARASPRPQLRVREGVGRNPSRTQLCDSNLHAVKTGHSELVRAVRSSACPEVDRQLQGTGVNCAQKPKMAVVRAQFRELPTTGAVDRKYHILSEGPDGTVYSFGGLASGGRGDERQSKPTASVLALDPAGEWSVLAPEGAPGAPSPRNEACGAIIENAIWVFGGSLESDAEGGGQGPSCDELWRFDIASHVWERVVAPDGPSPRCASGCATSGTILYIYGGGGVGLDQRIIAPLDDAFAFDTASLTWRELTVNSSSTRPPGRSLPQIAVPGDGSELWLFGGFSEVGSRLNDTWVLAGLKQVAAGQATHCSWYELPVVDDDRGRPEPRSCHSGATVHLPSESTAAGTAPLEPHWVIVSGRLGFGAAAFKDGDSDTTDADDVWLFNFRTRVWTEVEVQGGISPGPLRSHAMTAITSPPRSGEAADDSSAVVLVYGGRSEERPVLSATYELRLVCGLEASRNSDDDSHDDGRQAEDRISSRSSL